MLQECSHDATEQTLVSELVVPDASGSTVEENFKLFLEPAEILPKMFVLWMIVFILFIGRILLSQ